MRPTQKQEPRRALAVYRMACKALYGAGVEAPVSKLTAAQRLGLYSPRQAAALVDRTEIRPI